MTTAEIINSLKSTAQLFVSACINNPQKCGLTKSEKLWMEELSKIYLTAELDIKAPEAPNEEFSKALTKATDFGFKSAVMTRIILAAFNLVNEKEFAAKPASYLATLEHHQEQWSRKFIEATHAYEVKRPIEDFMHAYFDAPESVDATELTYYLTLYFKHFYRLLYQFMLSYTKDSSSISYGRANV